MKKNLLYIVTLFVVHFAFGQDKDQVIQTFNAYKSAILENKGTQASELISERTKDFYDLMIQHALESDSATVDDLPFFDKFTVLIMRHSIPKDQLLVMDSKGFFKYSVEHDYFEKESIIGAKMIEVTVEGNFAQCKMMLNNEEVPYPFNFYKENDKWQFDLISLMKVTTGYLVDFINSSDYTVNDLIFEALFRQNGKPPKPSIWQPMR